MKKSKRAKPPRQPKPAMMPSPAFAIGGVGTSAGGLLVEREQQRDLLEIQNGELGKADAVPEISHQRFPELYEQAPVGYLTFDAQGCIRAINAEAVRLLGVGRPSVIGKPFIVYVGKADRKKFSDHLFRMRRAAFRVATDLRLVTKEGTVRQVRMTTDRHHDAEGHSTLFLSAIEDVTELRAASANAAYLAAIVESSQDGVMSFTTDGIVLSWNAAAERHLGYGAAEMIGRHRSILVPEDRRGESERVLKVAASGERVPPFETVRRRKDGTLMDVEISLSPIVERGRVVAVTLIGRDIFERKRAERALHESEERLRLAQDAARMGSWDWDMQKGEILWSRNHEIMFGYEPGTPRRTYADFQDRMHPEDAGRVEAAVKEAITKRTDYSCEFRVVWPDGSIHWVSGFGRFHFDLEGHPNRMVGMIEEITERKRAEEKIREGEERFRALVTASSDVVYRMSPDWSEMRRLSSRDFLANTDSPNRNWLQEYIHPEDQPQVLAAIRKAIRNRSVFELEHRVLREDGTLGWAFSRAIPLKDAKGKITEWFGAASDVTARKRAEDAIRTLNAELEERVIARTTSLLTSTKSLTATVAALQKTRDERTRLEQEVIEISETERERIGQDLHDDLGQQLAGLWFFSAALEKSLRAQGSPEADNAAKIAGQLNKALALTRSLAHGLQPVMPEPGGLMAALVSLTGRSSELFKIKCRLKCHRPVEIHDPGAATHLYRIAQEAVTNAARHAHAKHVTILLVSSQKELVLSVTDDGKGMEETDGKHEGMGIRTMNYRAEAMGGTLIFRNNPRGGTSVICTTPPPKKH